MAGQIIPRGLNTWLVRVFLGRDENGKRKYLNKTIHGTKKEAQKWLTSALRDRDMGMVIEPATSTLNTYLDRWLDTAMKPKVRPKTFAGYTQALALYVRPRMGTRPLAKITSVEVQTVYGAMRENGLSPRTIQYTNMILKQAFKQAIRWRLAIFNPCDGVKVPRQERKEMEVLSADQARKFIAAAKMDKYSALFELAITSGLRPSEYAALKWSDIDWGKGTLSINRSLDTVPGGGWEFAENKTGRSRRTVRLHGNVLRSLAEWRTTQASDRKKAKNGWTDHGLMFTNDIGGPVDRRNLSHRNFRAILKAAKLPRIRLYDLRHTAATLGLAAGVPIKVISEQLGHSGAALTL